MPDNQNQINTSQTLVIDENELNFEAIEHSNGVATVIKFKLGNPAVRVGDVLLVLSGEEIHFHGLIGRVEEEWAMAMDRSGSMLPAHLH